MRLFDFHCDTLYKATTTNGSLLHNDYHISIEKADRLEQWLQVMAVWIPDEIRGQAAFDFVSKCADNLRQQLSQAECNVYNPLNFNELVRSQHRKNIILAVEGGAALNGDIRNVKKLKDIGVQLLTLTWNGKNELGDGVGVINPKGLTNFGREAVAELERNKIVIDISHASEPLFWDVAQIAARPFVATHSNSRTVCNHKRNLTDDQFKYMVSIKGIVGLNFCYYFLKDNGMADINDLLKHTEHFLSLGGEKTICIGSDFDGAAMPNGITGIHSMEKIYDYFLRHNYNEQLLKDIFFNNGYKFCENFDN